MTLARAVAVGVGLVALGVAVGTATVWLHPLAWGLPLGVAATVAALFAVRAGWRRLGYGVGWVAAAGWFLISRPEGDFVVSRDAAGYTMLGLGLVVVVLTVATVPARRRSEEP